MQYTYTLMFLSLIANTSIAAPLPTDNSRPQRISNKIYNIWAEKIEAREYWCNIDTYGNITINGNIENPQRHSIPALVVLNWRSGIAPELPDPEQKFALVLNGSRIRDSDIGDLVHLKNLICVDLSDNNITDKALEILSNMKQLEAIRLKGCLKVSEVGLSALSQMNNLRILDLTDMDISEKALSYLSKAKNLQTLNLSYTKIGKSGISELCSSKSILHVDLSRTGLSQSDVVHLSKMNQLKMNDISNTKVTNIESLANLTQLESLRMLKLQIEPNVTGDVLGRLTQLKHLAISHETLTLPGKMLQYIGNMKSLNDLFIMNFSIHGHELKYISNLNKLRVLKLISCELSDKSIVPIYQLKMLEEIVINHAKISDDGLVGLSEFKNLKHLELINLPISNKTCKSISVLDNLSELVIESDKIDDLGVSHIKCCTKLSRLTLYSKNISDNSFVHLSSMSGLVYMHLTHTSISANKREQLREKLPRCEILP